MPPYVFGLADFAPPHYLFKCVTSATFVLNADPNKLEQICNVFLNEPLNRTAANGFVPGGSQRVLMCCSTFPTVEAPGAALGYSAYTEVTLLFSVFDHLHQKWSWYAPVLYLDGPPANAAEWQAELPIAVGREMYGLPKTRGDLDLHTTYYTGSMEHIDPMTTGYKMNLADSVTISLGACATQAIDDEIAQQGGALLDLLIAEHEARTRRLPRRKVLQLRRKLGSQQRRVARVQTRRDEIAKERHAAMLDLVRLRDNPRERELLTPYDLIDMFWGGDPYARVGVPRPPLENDWLASLGFIKKAPHPAGRKVRRKKRGGRVLRSATGPAAITEPEPRGDYELQFWLLGLRQLHEPQPAKFTQAAFQQVVRTELRFNDMPFKPAQFYCVDIKDSPMARLLGIGPAKQTIWPVNNFAYNGATAWFGETATIVT